METKNDFMVPYEYDRVMKTRERMNEIPFINFPHDWQIRISPPFAAAVIRFQVKKNDRQVSVYLDFDNRLGFYDLDKTPYWEVYPHEGDTFRCAINETQLLLKAIDESLNQNKD